MKHKGRPETGKDAAELFRVSGRGHRASGSAVQVRGLVPGLTPAPDDPNQGPEGRDPRPENVSPANHPVSGFPLSSLFMA